MSEQPTAEELAMNLGAHLDSLKEYFSGKLPEGNTATPIRKFYHVAGHVAAIRRALHAEARVLQLEKALRALTSALDGWNEVCLPPHVHFAYVTTYAVLDS